MTETEKALRRLLRRVGKAADEYAITHTYATFYDEEIRALSKTQALRMVQGFIRDELGKVKKP